MCLWPQSVSQVLTSQSLQLDVLMATVSQVFTSQSLQLDVLMATVSQVLTSQGLQLDVLMAVSQSGIDITEFAARCAYGHSQSVRYLHHRVCS